MAPVPPRRPTPEALFADFLDRLEGGEQVDFEAVCSAHPEAATALRKVHARWLAMSEAFAVLSQDGSVRSTPSSSRTVDDLKAQLSTPGGRLARYALRDEIARGGMGRIVTAWDGELRREVALKIHAGAPDDARQQRRFLEEAQIAAQLDHPGIVPVHELGVDGAGRPFFAMQLVRGRHLGEILAAVRKGDADWSRTRVLSLLLRVCEAMAFAHDKGVVHRDLKPANIMVGRYGETYVMDWGLAHAHGRTEPADAGAPPPPAAVATLRQTIAADADDAALLTRQGDVLGTPAYMAPEQAAGASSTSPVVDVYSLGAILYHLLAGAMPYAAAARSADGVLDALRAGPPPPLPDDVPPELRAVCERAMARAPEQRYPTMLAFAEDLRAYLEVRTVSAYATGRFAELRKWIARNRTLAAVLAGFALAVAVGAVAMATLWVRAEDHRRLADANAQRLGVELDRSAFRSARQALLLGDGKQAAAELWRAHFAGRAPRATTWALRELARRDPYVVAEPRAEACCVAFTPDAAHVLTGGSDGTVEILARADLAVVARIATGTSPLTALAAVDDATAVAGNAAGELLRIDLTTRSVVHREARHGGALQALAVVGKGLVTGGADGRVLWQPEPAAPARQLLDVDAAIRCLALRPNGDAFFAGTANGSVHGLAFDGSWQVRRLRLGGSIASLGFGPDPNRLYVGDTNHQIRVLDFAAPERQWVHWTSNGTPDQIAGLRDGTVLLGGWWRSDRMDADGQNSRPLALRPVARMAMSRDERWLVTSHKVSGLGIVDLAPKDRRRVAGAGATGLAGNGLLLATSAGDHATIHDVVTGAVVRELPPGSNGWLSLDPTGALLAVTQLQPGRVSVWDVATGTRLHTGEGPTGGTGTFTRFSPDGSELAFALGVDRVRRVVARTGELVAEHSLSGARGFGLAWSGDGTQLACLAYDHPIVRVFDVRRGGHRDVDFADCWPGTLPRPVNLAAVALSRDGSTIAVGSGLGPIRVRHADGTMQALSGHAGTVWSLQFAPDDDRLLLSTGGAQGVAAWDLDTGECCFQAIDGQASQMELSRDGATLSCTTTTGAVLLDLRYHDRHVAGNLPFLLDRLRAEHAIDPARESTLRRWAAEVLQQPWPRWQ